MTAYRITALAAAAILTVSIASQAFANAGHSGSHTFGEPGQEAEVTQTIVIQAHDANGDMRFKHDKISIKKGETIKFVVTNKGALPHEFTLGDSASQRGHALMMEKDPDMKHEGDPSAITLQPGETKELIWKFSKPIRGNIEFACQMPGHYEAGMVSKVKMAK
jgi:uncharacterized cupredoxin-like copper-binding protein